MIVIASRLPSCKLSVTVTLNLDVSLHFVDLDMEPLRFIRDNIKATLTRSFQLIDNVILTESTKILLHVTFTLHLLNVDGPISHTF